jgi:cation transport ATPase
MTGNVIAAVLFNIVGMILAAMGFITPSLAIIFMIVSIFAILLNTLRIRVIKLEREEIAEEAGVESRTLAELELLIPNMACEGCAEKISKALTSLSGVREVKPKVSQKHVYVRCEPAKVQEHHLKDTVEKAGFTALEA